MSNYNVYTVIPYERNVQDFPLHFWVEDTVKCASTWVTEQLDIADLEPADFTIIKGLLGSKKEFSQDVFDEGEQLDTLEEVANYIQMQLLISV